MHPRGGGEGGKTANTPRQPANQATLSSSSGVESSEKAAVTRVRSATSKGRLNTTASAIVRAVPQIRLVVRSVSARIVEYGVSYRVWIIMNTWGTGGQYRWGQERWQRDRGGGFAGAFSV